VVRTSRLDGGLFGGGIGFLDHEDGSQEAYMHRNVIVRFGEEVQVMYTLAAIRQSVVHFTTMPMALDLTSLTASNHSKQSN